jgi:hypothetical protein
MYPHKSHFETIFPYLHYLYFVTDNCITFMDGPLFINATDSSFFPRLYETSCFDACLAD